MTHEHRCQGQTLRHSHRDGTTPHGYHGHYEDPQPETIQPGEVYVHPDGAEVRLAAETQEGPGAMTDRPRKRIELHRPRRTDEGYDHELWFTSDGGSGTNIERLTDADLDELRRVVGPPPAGSVIEFEYALHDGNDSWTRCTEISDSAGIEIDPDGELAQLIGRPFYEVILRCTLDTVTGEVEILGARKP